MNIRELKSNLKEMIDNGYGNKTLNFSDQDGDSYCIDSVEIDSEDDVCLHMSLGADEGMTVKEAYAELKSYKGGTFVYPLTEDEEDNPLLFDLDGEWYLDEDNDELYMSCEYQTEEDDEEDLDEEDLDDEDLDEEDLEDEEDDEEDFDDEDYEEDDDDESCCGDCDEYDDDDESCCGDCDEYDDDDEGCCGDCDEDDEDEDDSDEDLDDDDEDVELDDDEDVDGSDYYDDAVEDE